MKFSHRPALHSLITLFLFIPLAFAQIDPALYSGLRWRLVGPFRGGRALAVAGIPGQPNTYYFGGVGGGVWKTTDGGRVWQSLFDHQSVASIGALAISPADANVIYAGTGEADMRSDISFGNGIYKSTDGGQGWKNVGLRDAEHIARIIINPRDPNIILVAVLGHAYGPNVERGVFRSNDAGATWQKVLYKDENTGAIDLSFDPADPLIVYAALWQTRRPPWSVYPPSGGPGSGFYKSTDGGDTWHQLTGNGLPAGEWGRVGVAVAPSAAGRIVYALIDGKDGGLYRSDDSGASWHQVGNDPRIRGRAWYFSEIIVDPKNPDVVYAPNVSLYRSTDGGHNFVAIKGAPGGDDYHSMWIDPADPQRMIFGSDQGVSISVDDGKTWSSWYNQPTAQFYHVSTDNQFPYRVYGAQQDSGTASTTSRSDYGEITFRDWHSIGAGESGYIVPDPVDPNIVYGGSTYGELYRFDQRSGQSQDISPWPASAFGTNIAQRKYRFTWTTPLAFSPQNPHVLYMGAQYVLQSANGGASWSAISPDLTGCDPKFKNSTEAVTVADAKAHCYGVVYTLTPSAVQAGVIWAGSDTGLVHLTRDGGKNWSNVTPPGLSDWSKVTLIEASPFDAATAYAAVDRHRLDDFNPYIYRTHDYGKTWAKITDGINPTAYVHVVREDPIRRGLLYAGTETGVYFSLDEGTHWQSLQLNLPTTSVRDLVIHGSDLVVATHGRSFWILDDVTPLRQISAQTAQQPAHLFPPATAIRVRRDVNNDTPLPPEVPAGENPPTGAILYYWLKSAPQDAVKLEIFDRADQLVRSFSSNDKPLAPEVPLPFASYWLIPPTPLSKEPGMHRFVWDLRYASPPTLFANYTIAAVVGENTPVIPEGPLVLPGNYEARLTIENKIYNQSFTVKMDPRVSTPAGDLEKQLNLAMKIADALRWDYAAVQQINDLRKQLKNLLASQDVPQGKDSVLFSSVQTLDASAAALLGEGSRSPAQSDNLRALNGTLANLEDVVDSADRAPTSQAYAVFADTEKQLADGLTQWQSLKDKELATLNSTLAAQHKSPIAFPPIQK